MAVIKVIFYLKGIIAKTNSKSVPVFALFYFFFSSANIFGDKIYLKDLKVIEGKIQTVSTNKLFYVSNEKIPKHLSINRAEIAKIQYDDGTIVDLSKKTGDTKTVSNSNRNPNSGNKIVSITNSPLHLALPIYEFSAEFKILEKFSTALIGGYGTFKASALDAQTIYSDPLIKAYEIGGQFRFYPVDNWVNGLHLGVEALYLGMLTNIEGINLNFNGLAIGPLIGYKLSFDFGLTLDFQLGYQKLFMRAQASKDNQSASSSGSDYAPLLNINVGWTF